MSMTRTDTSAPVAGTDTGRPLREHLVRWSSPALILGLFLAWEIVVRLWAIPIYIMPRPSALLADVGTNATVLGRAWRTTMYEALTGFVIGNVLSVTAAFVITWSATARATIMPFAIAIKSVPMVAITPIITLTVGFGSATVITVAAIVCFFPTLVNVSRGLKATPRGSLDLMRIVNANEVQTFFKVRMPFALPYLFTALRITAPAAIGATMVAEYVASNSGLGYMIQDSYAQFRFVMVWQIVILATVTTLGAFVLVTRTESAVLRRLGGQP